MTLHLERVVPGPPRLSGGRHSHHRKQPLVERGVESSVHALVVDDEWMGQAWAEVLTGLRLPQRGRVRIFGEEPAKSPALRAQTGSCLAMEPREFAGKTVRQHLDALPRSTSDEFLHEEFLQRSTDSLGDDERRLVALAAALRIEQPRLLVLFEPEACCNAAQRTRLFEQIMNADSQRTLILILCRSPRHAQRWSPDPLDLRSAPARRAAPQRILLRVERPREIARELIGHEAVTRVELDERSVGTLAVWGVNAERVADATLRAVVAAQCDLFEMSLVGPVDVKTSSSWDTRAVPTSHQHGSTEAANGSTQASAREER